MSNVDWIYTYGFLGSRVFDLPSLLICLLIIIIFGYKYNISYKYQIVLVFHCFLPFVLNDVIFKASYMPDQFRYWYSVNSIRNGDINIFNALNDSGNVLQASALLSLVPLPKPVSIISLGFYNTFLYIVLFIILYAKRIFTNVSVWFYLLFPSAALYTALSLRETMIFFFMTLTVIYARESKIFKSFVLILPIYLIKFQNFFILGPVVLIYYFFKVAKKGMSLTKALSIGIVSLIALLLSAPIAIPLINKFRIALYAEDGGDRDDISLISSASDFVFQGLTSALYFLAKPLPWEANGALGFIQSIENLVVLAVLFLITLQAWKLRPDKLFFWLLFLAFSMSIYGLVVFNYGTAVRYRYPFIIIYVIFVCADCNIHSLRTKESSMRYKLASIKPLQRP